MSGDVLGVSISGLRVSQNAIATTGHNIANANTDGYSRQIVDVNSAGGTSAGAFYYGDGAYTANVKRIVDGFVTTQVREDTSLHSELNAYNEFIGQLDSLLANSSTGLTQGLDSFFSAVQNVADDPSSISSRQLLLSESESLVDRFTTLYSRIDSIQDNVNTNVSAAVNKVNSLAETIANLNKSISDNQNSIAGQPNDLLDQRDEALRQLSELISAKVTVQDSNVVNVSLANGLTIVLGDTASEFSVGSNEFDASQPEIYLDNTAIGSSVTEFFVGGEIGGLSDFQDTIIDPTLNDLGRLALVIADEMNRLQQQGITLNNEFGGDLFQDINHSTQSSFRTVGSRENATNDQVMTLTIDDVSELTGDNYIFSITNSGNNYIITREASGEEVLSNGLPVLPANIEFEGVILEMTSGTLSAGDNFLIQPSRYAARNIATEALAAEDLALGSPVLTSSDLGNQGSASISSGEVLAVVNSSDQTLPLFAQAGEFSPPLLVQFTTATTYDVLDNSDSGQPVQLDPPIRNQVYVPGIANNLFASNEGQTTVASTGTALGLPAANTSANAYPAETFTFTTTDPSTGITTTQAMTSVLNASAKTTASTLDNLTGVTANAFNYLELRDFTVSRASPLQVSLNAEDLVEYDGAALHANVPDPAVSNGEDFNDYLAGRINGNDNLQALGIYATSAYDAANAEYYIQVHSTQGDDLNVGLEALAGEVIEVTDGNNAEAITGAGAGSTNTLVVGGRIDVAMNDNIVMTTTPSTSTIFGDSTAATFAGDSFIGIQASINGSVQAGDRFTLDFNADADMDNRNALEMVALQKANTMNGETQSVDGVYGTLIETVGIKANSSANNTKAAEELLEQTVNLRNSISGVNLDEEAANLIRYEQLYTANAQVINVARELFSQLINSF